MTRLQITSHDPQPLTCFGGWTTAPGGRGKMFLPIYVHVARVRGLPEALDGLIFCSDLQAIDDDQLPVARRQLVGLSVASQIADLCNGEDLPDASRVGVGLAGDFYAVPTLNKRGGLGEVMAVWRAFASRFRWVVAVAGNHDSFDGQCQLPRKTGMKNLYGLDGRVVVLDGLRIGGVSGIIGRSKKPWRRPREQYLADLCDVMTPPLDILLTHCSPQPEPTWLGEPSMTSLLLECEPMLAVSGHVHWPEYWHDPAVGGHWLNVDARVVCLVRDD